MCSSSSSSYTLLQPSLSKHVSNNKRNTFKQRYCVIIVLIYDSSFSLFLSHITGSVTEGDCGREEKQQVFERSQARVFESTIELFTHHTLVLVKDLIVVVVNVSLAVKRNKEKKIAYYVQNKQKEVHCAKKPSACRFLRVSSSSAASRREMRSCATRTPRARVSPIALASSGAWPLQ